MVSVNEDDFCWLTCICVIFVHNTWAKIVLLMSCTKEILRDTSPLLTRPYSEAVQSNLSTHAPFFRHMSILFSYPPLHRQNSDDETFLLSRVLLPFFPHAFIFLICVERR